VILTPPVPQALELVSRGGLLARLPADLRDALETVRYRPAFVLLMRLAERCPRFPSSGVLSLPGWAAASRGSSRTREAPARPASQSTRGRRGRRRSSIPPRRASPRPSRRPAACALGFDPAAVLERDLKAGATRERRTAFPRRLRSSSPTAHPFSSPGTSSERVCPLAGNTGLERALLSGLAAAGRVLGIRG